MYNDAIPWDRYWSPRDQPATLDEGGFLIGPGEVPLVGYNDHLHTLDELNDQPCLVLLGPAGMGKTYAIQQALVQLKQREDVTTAHLDLRAATENLLQMFIQDQAERAEHGERDFHVFLDSADMYREGLPALAQLLAREMEGSDLLRCRLRIACRPAHWSPQVEAILDELFSDVDVLDLAPLRRTDARLALESNGIDPDSLMQTVRASGVEPLAAQPITLQMLLAEAGHSGELPASPAELYGKACHRLCEDIWNRDGSPRSYTSSEQRFATARRLAATTLVCHKTGFTTHLPSSDRGHDLLTIPEVSGGREPVEDGSVRVDETLVRETLATGLFEAGGEEEIHWAHISYAEHLAARYLVENEFDPATVDEVLFTGSPTSRRLAPPVKGVAAWLATMDRTFFERILETDPEVLLEVDLSPLRDADREALTERLLSMIDVGLLGMRDVGGYSNLERLHHSTLATQLRQALGDKTRSAEARGTAVRIAAACGLPPLEPDILGVLFDNGEPYHLRVTCAHAIAYSGTPDSKREMGPLLGWDEEADPDYEFKGCALRALWPAELRIEELLDQLDPPRNPRLAGAYSGFLSSLPSQLSPDDLPLAVQWVCEQRLERGDTGMFSQAGDAIIREAILHADRPDVRTALANLAVDRFDQYRPMIYRGSSDWNELWAEQDDARRLLVRDILARWMDPDRASNLLSTRTCLVSPQDFDWIIQACAGEGDPVLKESYATLLLHLDEETPRHTERLYDLCQSDQAASKVLSSLFDPIKLGSNQAAKLQERHREITELKDRRDQEPTNDPAVQEIRSNLVGRLLDGDIEAWWRLCHVLQFDEQGIHAQRQLNPDIRQYPGWSLLDEDLKTLLPEICTEYLEQYHIDAEDPYETFPTSRPACSAYRALHHLETVSPNLLDELNPEAWERWTPIILYFPFGTVTDETGIQARLLARAYEAAPDAVVDGVRVLLPREGGEDQISWDPRVIHSVLGGEVTQVVFEALIQGDLTAERDHLLATMLLEEGHEATREYLRRVLTQPPDPSEEETWIGLALALLEHEGADAWDRIWPNVRENPDFADRFLKGILDELALLEGSPPTHLRPNQWASLYLWLRERYPPDDDPEFDSGFGLDFRWSIARWRDRIPSRLASEGTPEAVSALQGISDQLDDPGHLPRLIRKANATTAGESWDPPTPSELRKLAAKARRRAKGRDEDQGRGETGRWQTPTKGLFRKIEDHPAWTVFIGLGTLASIISLGLVLAGVVSLPSVGWLGGDGSIHIEGIEVAQRGPIWGHESFDGDEIVISIHGTLDGVDVEEGDRIVAFWRLANDYETNWHVGKRRVGGNYELATIDAVVAQQGPWDFTVGGIEADKEYEGSVSVVLTVKEAQVVENSREAWLEDRNGWGFREIPERGSLAITPPRSFNVSRVR